MNVRRTLRLSAVAALVAVAASACGGESTPKAASPAEAEAAMSAGPADAGVSSVEPAPSRHTTHRVVVSFTSIGTGIDGAARDQLLEILDRWRIAKGHELETERRRWGKEGETDVCVTLDELSDAERGKFLGEVRAVAGKSDRVQITESATCRGDHG